MITYRCSVAACRLAGERLLPVVAEALHFECPECHGALEPDGHHPWSLTISSDHRLWPTDHTLQLPFFAADEIDRLRTLFRDDQTYGAILQLRDVLEVLLKLPVLLGASRILSLEEPSSEERGFLYAIVEKALSLGDWHRIAGIAIGGDIRLPPPIREVIAQIKRLFDQHDVPHWRNDTIGHGALGFDTDTELRADLEAKLLAIADHLRAVAHLYGEFDVEVHHEGMFVSLRGKPPSLLTGASSVLSLVVSDERWPIFPYVHLIDGGIFFFDAYYHHRLQNTALLNYTDGHKRRERFRRLAELYEHLVLTTRLKVATPDFEPQVRTKDQDQVFFRDWEPDDIVEPQGLVNWLRTALDEEDKGVFILQMERGCGKTTLCRHIDDLRRSRPIFETTAVRVHYGNDLYGYIPGNFTWTVTDGFRTDRRSASSMTGSIPFLSPSAVDKPRALASHLEFFLTQRRRLYGDRRIVLVIDAIDETPLQGEAPILDFIPNPGILEAGIFILVTARVDDELQPAIRRRIADLVATRRMVIARGEPANLQPLRAYLRKMNTPQALWDHFLTISEQRFLYLRALLGALALFEARSAEELPRGGALIEVLLDKLGRIYGRHAEHLNDIAAAIAFAYEPLSIEEICFLISERYPSLRTAAFLRDISGMLRVDRSERGNVYSIGHEEIATTLRRRFAARQEMLVRLWVDSLRGEVGDLLNEPSAGLDYLLAYVTDYAAAIGADLFAAHLAERFVIYALREEASQTFERRRRLILLTAFRWLDRRDDPATYLAAGTRVPTPFLIQVLEQRLTENDATLSGLLRSPDLSAPSVWVFFRALAASAYQTQNYASAAALADRLYALTRSTPDLVNLALMLKGTDTDLDGAYTMARAREIADELLAGTHSHDLTPSQRGYVLYTIGRVFCDTLEHAGEAVPILKESLQAFESIDEELAVLAVKNAIAISLLDTGDFRKAASGIRDVVAAMRAGAAEFPKHAVQAALVNAYILSFLAEDEISDPLDVSSIGKWEVRAYHLNNRFIVEYAKGNAAAAKVLAAECLSLTADHRGVYSRATILNNAGVVYGRRPDIVRAHDICKASGYSIGAAITGHNLGLAYPVPKGVLPTPSGLLWPCTKNFDILLPV
jgi:hypothetical protein